MLIEFNKEEMKKKIMHTHDKLWFLLMRHVHRALSEMFFFCIVLSTHTHIQEADTSAYEIWPQWALPFLKVCSSYRDCITFIVKLSITYWQC